MEAIVHSLQEQGTWKKNVPETLSTSSMKSKWDND